MSLLPTDTCNRCGHFRIEHKEDTSDSWYQRCQHKECREFNSVTACTCDHFFWYPAPEDTCARCGHARMYHDERRGCVYGAHSSTPGSVCLCLGFYESQMPFRWLQDECGACGHARSEHAYANGIPYLGRCSDETQVADGSDAALWRRCGCTLFREPESGLTYSQWVKVGMARAGGLPGVCLHCGHSFGEHHGDQGHCRHITPVNFEATAGHGVDCPCAGYVPPYALAPEGRPLSGRKGLRRVHVTESLSYRSGKFEPNWNGWFHDFFQNSGSEMLIGPVALVEDDEGGLNLVPVRHVVFIPGA